MLQVISCLSNSIEDHMMGEQAEHEHEHHHSDACCHGDHPHTGHSHDHDASNGKASGHDHGQQVESNAEEESGSDEEGDKEEDGGDKEEGHADLVFPATYSLALAQLLSADSTPVNVRDIRLDGDEAKLDLAVTLWKEGIVCVPIQIARKAPKKNKK